MCPGNLGYYNLEKMKNHHYPERQDTEGFPPSILSDLKIKQKGISILFCTALVTPEQSQPFQRDFEVNAIDMLGLKAQEGVQYAWGCGDTGKIVKAVWWAKIFICSALAQFSIAAPQAGSSFLIFPEWQGSGTAVV